MAKVVVGTVTGVAARGAQLPGARRLVLTGVQCTRVSAVGAKVACKKVTYRTIDDLVLLYYYV